MASNINQRSRISKTFSFTTRKYLLTLSFQVFIDGFLFFKPLKVPLIIIFKHIMEVELSLSCRAVMVGTRGCVTMAAIYLPLNETNKTNGPILRAFSFLLPMRSWRIKIGTYRPSCFSLMAFTCQENCKEG